MFMRFRTTILITLVAILPVAAQGQSPTPPSPSCDSACTSHAAGGTGMGMGSMGNMDMAACMRMMAAGDARLDSLVTAMHSATGAARTSAMERVIEELLAQRKGMHEHMMGMMHGHAGMPESGHRESHDSSGHQ